MSDYILTYSKIKFYPLEPVMEDIKIEDIAHSLSLMTRANGHFRPFLLGSPTLDSLLSGGPKAEGILKGSNSVAFCMTPVKAIFPI